MTTGGTDIRSGGLSALPAEGFRVLIVEDNPHIIEMYSYVLKKLASGELAGKVPLEVHFAAGRARRAEACCSSRASQLVMTDLYMPVMDGFVLVEKIRQEERLKTIPVIAISAGGKDAQERAMDVGRRHLPPQAGEVRRGAGDGEAAARGSAARRPPP